VDVAAAPLLITDDRQAAVDFSSPFLRGHATILIRKPDTKDRANPLLISSARDLVRQSELTFGTLNTGVLVKAFKTSNNTLYRTMWTQMSTRATTTVFTRTNQEGVTRVRRGGYAFILPSIIGDYVSRQAPCDLTTVDSFLLDMDYGLALPKGSGLRRRIDDVLASLRATGALGELYRKWWKQKVDCADDVVNTQAQQQRRLPVSVSAAAPVHVASVLICILPLLASLNLLFVCVRCAWYCHTDDV
jgi:ABC-type amino acid transport substrate-binding protein